jgi:TonB family protein
MVHLPLDVTVLRSGIPDRVPGRSVNLSERGVGVVLAAELLRGEAVGVELRLPERAQPQRWRAVVRYQDKLRCGMEFSGLSAEEKAAIQHCTERLKAVPEPVSHPSRPFAVLADALASYGAENNIDRSDIVKSDSPKVENSPVAEKPESKRSVVLLLLLLTTCAILLSVFWLRWNRGWEELESGLAGRQETATENPQFQVPAEEMQKLVLHRVDPDYPAAARSANLHSVIALDVIVGKDGSVVSVHSLNGPEILARSATNAMRWWKFEPYRVNGAPAVVKTTLAMEFKP